MNESYGSEGEFLGKGKKMSNVSVVKAERDWAVRIIGAVIVLLLGVLGFMARDIANTLWTVKHNQVGVMTRLDAMETGMKEIKNEITERFRTHEANEIVRGDTRAEYHHQNLGPCATCKRIPMRGSDLYESPHYREQFPTSPNPKPRR